MVGKINAAKFDVTAHAKKRLNERFNVANSDATKWARRFMTEAQEFDDVNNSNQKLFRKGQCVAVVDINECKIITAYQILPVDKSNGWGKEFTEYLQPYINKIMKRYRRDLARNLRNSFVNLLKDTVKFELQPHREKNMKQLQQDITEVKNLIDNGVNNLEMIARFKTKNK